MDHFVAVDLLPMLGSLYSWAIKRPLSEVAGKAGVCRAREGMKEAQVNQHVLGLASNQGCGLGAVRDVPPF